MTGKPAGARPNRCGMNDTQKVSLTSFLTARLDEDAAYLLSNRHHLWTERPLLEAEAKRAILELHKVNAEPERWGDSHSDRAMRGQPTGRTSYWCHTCDQDRDYGHIGGPQEGCDTLRHVAAVYSDHPDYRQEWKP